MNGRDRTTGQRRLSRETRRLLIAAVVALASLWVLARIRFPERPPTPNPIPPLLTQLSARPAFADLESEIARGLTRLSGSLFAFPGPRTASASESAGPSAALRIRGDAAMTFLPRTIGAASMPDEVMAMDRATGLAIVRVPDAADPTPGVWSPEALDTPRFLAITVVAADRVSLSPFYLTAVTSTRHAGWSGPVWTFPSDSGAPDGALLFTTDGDLAGALLARGNGRIIVPGATLLADAQRLLDRGRLPPGRIGVRAQPLTASLRQATGAMSGVIASFVEPESASAPYVNVGDVIVALNGVPIENWEQWDVRSNRLVAGDPVVLHVRRSGELRRIEIVAASPADTSSHAPRTLGLTLAAVTGTGSRVVNVEPGSAAWMAGLQAGDIITLFGDASAPAPSLVRRTYADGKAGQPLLVGITRGTAHQVLAIAK